MKKALLLAGLALGLSACAPALSALQAAAPLLSQAPTAPAPTPAPGELELRSAADPATLTLTPEGSFNVLAFEAGEAPALKFKLTVKGENLRVRAPDVCRPALHDLVCELSSVLSLKLPISGTVTSAEAGYQRGDGLERRKSLF